MDTNELRTNLERLHAELQSTESIDAESRELLASVLSDIESLLQGDSREKPSKSESLADRLEHALTHFEEEYPTLTSYIGQVADALSRLGI